MVKRWMEFCRAWIDYPLPEGSFIGRGRYKVLTQIGTTGSYGITYRCLDKTRQQVVAAKQAKPSKKRIS